MVTCQVLANVIVLFGLFGEPLSQTAQTMLPGLLVPWQERFK